MQHELEAFGTTPSQSMVVIGTMAAQLACRPPPPVAQAKTRGSSSSSSSRLRSAHLTSSRCGGSCPSGMSCSLASEQVLVLGPEGERLPLADGGQPRVPVPKSFVTNLSPIFAGRERTLCKL